MKLSEMLDNNNGTKKKKKKLKFLAKGSARAVYLVDDEKVIKKSFNEKGIEQNKQEIKTYVMLKDYKILAKIHSYAKDYSYLVMELCLRANKEDFVDKFNISFDEFKRAVKYLKQQIRPSKKMVKKPISFDSLMKNKWFNELSELILKWELATGDLKRLSSWGINREGRLVLIDYGLSIDIYRRLYKEKPNVN